MQASEQKAIEVTDLTVAYQDKPVLWDIDFDVPPGVLLSIVGPNGAGKNNVDQSDFRTGTDQQQAMF